MSRQMQIMSPRRLDAIRANGNDIINPKMRGLNDNDAASNYKRGMERGSAMGAQQAQGADNIVDERVYQAMDDEMEMNANLHLVPCRWERSGWRYVQRDPGQQEFFNNPNRVNSFGVDSGKKRHVSQNARGSFYNTANNRSAFGAPRNNLGETTYGRTFARNA